MDHFCEDVVRRWHHPHRLVLVLNSPTRVLNFLRRDLRPQHDLAQHAGQRLDLLLLARHGKNCDIPGRTNSKSYVSLHVVSCEYEETVDVTVLPLSFIKGKLNKRERELKYSIILKIIS